MSIRIIDGGSTVKMGDKEELPVLIYHENGQKRIWGGGLHQSYVRSCVKSAEKWNKNVVLLGSPENKSFASHWERADDYITEKWYEFVKVFENMAFYKAEWALGCFKAYFVYAEYMRKKGITECIILDSDILVYKTFRKKDDYVNGYATLSIRESDTNESNQYGWSADGVVGYFSREALEDFTDFCIDIYRNHREILAQKWEYHQKMHISGGVCDMTLLYLWAVSNPQRIMNFYNLKWKFNTNLKSRDGYQKGFYRKREILFENHQPYLIKENGEKELQHCLHFQGALKAYMEDYQRRENVGVKSHVRVWIANRLAPLLVQLRDRIKN